MNIAKPFATGCRMCGSELLKSRGMCDLHYRRFMNKFKRFKKNHGIDAANRFEEKCLLKGLIAEKSKGGRPKDGDALDEIEAEVIAELRSGYLMGKGRDSERDQIVTEGDDVIGPAVQKARIERPSKEKRNQKGAG